MPFIQPQERAQEMPIAAALQAVFVANPVFIADPVFIALLAESAPLAPIFLPGIGATWDPIGACVMGGTST
jgi:hypothetical protein